MIDRPDSDDKLLMIERVANGWMIGVRDSKQHYDICSKTFVASSPDKLSQIIFEWAKGQQEKSNG